MRWITLLLIGCSCPPAPCRSRVDVVLRAEPWRVGDYALVVRAGAFRSDCTFRVIAEGEAPTNVDTACDGRIERAGFLLDTGWPTDASLSLMKVLPYAEAPDEIHVEVRYEGSVVLDLIQRPTWRDALPAAGRCAEACKATTIEVQIPDA